MPLSTQDIVEKLENESDDIEFLLQDLRNCNDSEITDSNVQFLQNTIIALGNAAYEMYKTLPSYQQSSEMSDWFDNFFELNNI